MGKVIQESRVPPHSLEAERAVLGTLLLDNATIPQVMESLTKDDFYQAGHQLIFEAICSVHDRMGVVDLTMLGEELHRRGQLENIGGASFVASLEQYVITTTNVAHHCRIVKTKARLRRLIEASQTIIEAAFGEEEEADAILDRSEKLIFDISQERMSRSFQSIGELTVETLEELNQMYQTRHPVVGLATGYYKLDEKTLGLHRSDLAIVAGRPSVGKTAFGLNIALNLANNLHLPVGIFSLEMSAPQINQRLLSILTRVDGFRLRAGKISRDDLELVSEKAKRLATLPIYIDDTPAISIMELRAKARRLKAQVPELSMIMVDYMQLVRGSGKTENRQQEVSEISGSLKALARELAVSMVAISQLSRQVEQRRGRDKRPLLSDLRESGAIEQDADLVLFVHREVDPRKGEEEVEPEALTMTEVIIGKQRNGPLGTVLLHFFPRYTFFANPATGVEEEE